MNKADFLKWIQESPENTNVNVIGSLLQGMADEEPNYYREFEVPCTLKNYSTKATDEIVITKYTVAELVEKAQKNNKLKLVDEASGITMYSVCVDSSSVQDTVIIHGASKPSNQRAAEPTFTAVYFSIVHGITSDTLTWTKTSQVTQG